MRSYVPFFIVALFVLAAPEAGAQTITGGAMAGVGFTSLPHAGEVLDQVVGSASTESSSKIGPLFGGFVRLPIADQWSLQPELQFIVKGVTLTEAATGGSAKASIRYLEFPVLMRYQTSIGEHSVHLLAGPTFAVKAGTSAHLDGPNQTVDENIDPAIRAMDVGLALGAGHDFGRYFIDARYTRGLRDVATAAFPHADTLHNRTFALTGGIYFR
jgi:hypothetical protein